MYHYLYNEKTTTWTWNVNLLAEVIRKVIRQMSGESKRKFTIYKLLFRFLDGQMNWMRISLFFIYMWLTKMFSYLHTSIEWSNCVRGSLQITERKTRAPSSSCFYCVLIFVAASTEYCGREKNMIQILPVAMSTNRQKKL